MLYVFFWVILRRLNFICRRFGILCLFYFYRQVGKLWLWLFTYLPIKMEQTEYSETSAYKIQTPENYPEGNIQHACTTILTYKTGSNYTVANTTLHNVHFLSYVLYPRLVCNRFWSRLHSPLFSYWQNSNYFSSELLVTKIGTEWVIIFNFSTCRENWDRTYNNDSFRYS
jgi:hypothetical protein